MSGKVSKMNKGDLVTVMSCPVCPAVEGMQGTVREVNEAGDSVRISFGKGRPQKNRPEWFSVSTLQLGAVGMQVNGK